jgi:hypothetical protein
VSDSYHISRSITGEPSDKNRVHRAHRSSWDHMQRPGWSDVKVTLADGTVVEGVPASVFSRRTRSTRYNRQIVQQQETQQERRMRLLASVGNNSDVD